MKDGSPLLMPDRFFRKAIDNFTHDTSPDGKITDPDQARFRKSINQPKQLMDLLTKDRISIDYLKNVLDTSNIPDKTLKLLIRFIQEKIDIRALTKMKNSVFDQFPFNRHLTLDEWKQESHRFMHIYPKDIED